MEGEGGLPNEGAAEPALQLGTVLTQLDQSEAEQQATAVETILHVSHEDPTRCLPTVPKLRSLLGSCDSRTNANIARCLEIMAKKAPNDVAPSVPAIVSFLTDSPSLETTTTLLECLEAVAEERPAIVADELEEVDIAVIAERVDGTTEAPEQSTDALATVTERVHTLRQD